MICIVALTQAFAACDSTVRSPSAPSMPTGGAPADSAALVMFTDPTTGFSTADVRDAGGEIVQFTPAGELIWTVDGARLSGYRTASRTIPAEPVCGCSLVVRFGTANSERRAYFTADYGHDNPGTLVDLDVVGGVLRVTRTDLYAPGTYTQSGVITQSGPTGVVPLQDAGIWRLNEEKGGWQVATTDRNGFYELRGLYDGSRTVSVIKEGYDTVSQDVVIQGDTRFDAQMVKR